MAAKVKEVSDSLADMEKQAPVVLLTMTIPEKTVAADSFPDRMTDSFLGESERPVGRADEVERIIEMLQVSSSDDVPRLSVISVVGFGGLGKTTLAQLVFEETEKKKLFDEMMWVCVSEPFDIQKILGEMLQKLDKTTGGLSSMDAIVRNLRQKLKDKRFLLVLDDVWNKESAKWDNLKARLEKISEKTGNFVIATTRSSDVANIMGTQHMVELKQLSDTECWSIIKERVVGNQGKSTISLEMETIGKELAYKCGGVPLAAKVVAGVLSSRKKIAEWLSIQRSNVWNEVDKDKRISGVLKLSFDHLPQPQKLCFAYCSLFRKDVVFDKARLIQFWMAEDLLNTTLTTGGTSAKLMEDVGEEYVHSLLNNSFFQDAEVDDYGNIITCKMHDLLHDLALSVYKSQRLQCGSDCIQTSDGRRLNCSCDEESKVQEILESSEDKTRYLRSLFCRVDITPMLSNFRRLRSLDMSDAKLKSVPDALKMLKHLRYFDISKNEAIEVLPVSITKLYNLQTLRFFKCNSLKELPGKIKNLVSLRHIGFDDKRLMPSQVGCLTNLQTLPFFVVGIQKGQRIDELGGLKELRGELVVCGLENVRDKGEAERAKMKEKQLSKLELQWMELTENEVDVFSSSKEGSHEKVMEGLEAPAKIQRLTVKWCMGKQFPEWMSQLTELVKLTLLNCRRCVTMPTLGYFPNLKVLSVVRMDCTKTIVSGESNNVETLFPSLQELYIAEMKSLVEWVSPKGTEIFPKLHKLSIRDCPDLTSFPLGGSSVYMKIYTYGSVILLCCLDNKYLEDIEIRDCPKLKFLHLGVASFESMSNLRGYSFSQGQEELVKNLSVFSNESGASWKFMGIHGAAINWKFLKSLEVLEFDEFLGELSVEAFHELTSLKHLLIRHPKYDRWASPGRAERVACYRLESLPSLSSLTSLEYLQIKDCDYLQSIPSLSSLTSLQILNIQSCYSLKIHCLSMPTCLKELRILGGSELREMSPNCFPTLTCLEKLRISFCRELRSLPGEIKLCTSLKELTVTECTEMATVDDDIIGSLTQLKKLEWGPFSYELDEVPGLNSIQFLTSLEQVKIVGWYKLTSLPHQLQYLTSITELRIERFRRVESLPDWFCNLQSLQTLSFKECRDLKDFPKTMLHLPNLTSLQMWRCRILEERCEKGDAPRILGLNGPVFLTSNRLI